MRKEVPHYKVFLEALGIELPTLDKGGHQTKQLGTWRVLQSPIQAFHWGSEGWVGGVITLLLGIG